MVHLFRSRVGRPPKRCPSPREPGSFFGALCTVLLAGLLGCGACGYRFSASLELPGGLRTVRLEPTSVARGAEPALAPLLGRALQRELGRRGVRASSTGAADGRLACQVVDLTGGAPLVGGASARVVLEQLELTLECRLSGAGGATLWRSGILHAATERPLPDAPATAEAAWDGAIRRLADAAAEQVVDGLATID